VHRDWPQSSGATSASQPSADFYLTLSLERYREARYAESIAASHAALELRSGYAEAWNNIGAAYNQLSEYDKAIGACEEALRFTGVRVGAKQPAIRSRDVEGPGEIRA
jgi:tetratricopeptide (TPR) repeat protein